MTRISILGEAEAIRALKSDLEVSGAISEAVLTSGTPAEVERLGFDLGMIETVVGTLGTAIGALELAKALIRAVSRGKSKVLEIKGPTATKSINLDGKTEEEVVEEIRKILPLMK